MSINITIFILHSKQKIYHMNSGIHVKRWIYNKNSSSAVGAVG